MADIQLIRILFGILVVKYQIMSENLISDKIFSKFIEKFFFYFSNLTYFRHIPWLTPSVLGIKCPRLQLHNEVVEFYKVFGPNPKEMQNRSKCFKGVKKAIKRYIQSKSSIDSRSKESFMIL